MQDILLAAAYINVWNELKLKFVGLIIALAEVQGENFKIFSQRELKAIINEIEIQEKVDFMVASGKYKHKKTYFCFHVEPESEIPTQVGKNKQENQKTDPRGQLLAEMLVAQTLNEDNLPVYGSYVSGRA